MRLLFLDVQALNAKEHHFILPLVTTTFIMQLKEICPTGNNKVVILYFLIHDKGLLSMLELH